MFFVYSLGCLVVLWCHTRAVLALPELCPAVSSRSCLEILLLLSRASVAEVPLQTQPQTEIDFLSVISVSVRFPDVAPRHRLRPQRQTDCAYEHVGRQERYALGAPRKASLQ